MTEYNGIIELEDMEFYAYHGCYNEEQTNGNKFIVNLKVKTDVSIPAKSDKIEDALDYVKIYELIKTEMAQRSHLLEHIASRILDKLFEQFYKIITAEVRVSKISPPIEGKIKSVSVILKR